MKCSGKQYPYPSEIERLNKEKKETKFNELIVQAKTNEENLKVLDEKFKFESQNISVTLQSNINNVTRGFHEDSENWKQEMKSLEHNLTLVRQQITEELTQKLRMGLDLST